MGILKALFGGSSEEEIPVLKESEHYPVDEAGVDEEAIQAAIWESVQSIRVCDRCAAVHHGAHNCRY